MAGKVDVQGICATVTGYQHYVPCRICTAWVPRMELEPGLLPDETHHDAPTLMKFWTEEKERRTAMADEWRKAMLKGRMLLGGFRTQDCVSKKPAAASKDMKQSKDMPVVTKKPAASTARLVKKPAASPARIETKPAVKKKPAAARR